MTMGGMTSPGTDGATDGDSTGPGQDDDGGGGCACTTSPERGGGWLAWMLLVPVAIARRSRRA
jgi:MYXO-CTERM domain-containing protein